MASGSDDAVRAALSRARFNETITIETITTCEDAAGTNPHEETTILSLVPCLDERTGGVQFSNLLSQQDDDNSLDPQLVRLSRELQTNRWFFPMLNDHRRNELYEQAIETACQVVVQNHNKKRRTRRGDDGNNKNNENVIRVLDIGSGTGLLAIWAAKHLQKLVSEEKSSSSVAPRIEVTSIEMSAPLATLARQTVADNGLSDVITIVEGHSTTYEYSSATTTADLCTSELLEDGLLGEGWLPALRDAWARHLIDDTTVLVPSRAIVCGQLVVDGDDDNWLSDLAGPHPHKWKNEHDNNDGSVGISFNHRRMEKHDASSQQQQQHPTFLLAEKQVVYPVHAAHLLKSGHLRAVSEPVALLECSVASPDIPTNDRRTVTIPTNAAASTAVRGVLVWWELELFDKIVYSTKPDQQAWQDHWHPCLHLFASSPSPSSSSSRTIPVKVGEPINIEARRNDSRIYVERVVSCEAHNRDDDDSERHKRPRLTEEEDDDDAQQQPVLISPERALQLNDRMRLHVLYESISDALAKANNPGGATVLDVSDFSLCAVMAAKLGARRVVSLESSSGKLPTTAARVAQLGNGIVPSESLDFEILQCHTEQLTLELVGGTPIDLVVAEPYYEILEGWHLQEALNLYHSIRYLRSQNLLSDRVKVLPNTCHVMACIVQSQQLCSAYISCPGDKIRGVDHSFVNRVGGRFHEYDLSLPFVQQYDYDQLSEVVELGVLTYSDPEAAASLTATVRGHFLQAGRCDALLVWLEYQFPVTVEGAASNRVVSTKNRSHRQIIRMLHAPPPAVTDLQHAVFDCTCKLGGIEGIQDHSFHVEVSCNPQG